MITGNIIITALPPIDTKGLQLSDVELLMEKTHDLMFQTFKATSKEVQENILDLATVSMKSQWIFQIIEDVMKHDQQSFEGNNSKFHEANERCLRWQRGEQT